jgi:hypothetical protein
VHPPGGNSGKRHFRPEDRARTLTALALAATALIGAEAGGQDPTAAVTAQAEAAASTVSDPYDRAKLLAEMAVIAVEAGKTGWADRLYERAGASADKITGHLFDHDADGMTPTWRYRSRDATLLQLADVAANAGRPHSAMSIALLISAPDYRARSLAEIAVAAARGGWRTWPPRSWDTLGTPRARFRFRSPGQ